MVSNSAAYYTVGGHQVGDEGEGNAKGDDGFGEQVIAFGFQPAVEEQVQAEE
ncbi:hypothetical protein [Selenomonas sp. FC4001]|uniref:hypothetical protein n=1 Tax=Selenomonas sp. FC4001 TaxID=1408313 RepID=UPI000A48D07E|nr:hypothetical protein [Selenomonas sp. FC4001]